MTTTSEVLYAHMHNSGVSQGALQQRVAVLEAIVAKMLPQSVTLDWEVSSYTVGDKDNIWYSHEASPYRLHGNGKWWSLKGNGLDIEGRDVEQLKQIALNHLHCNIAALDSVR